MSFLSPFWLVAVLVLFLYGVFMRRMGWKLQGWLMFGTAMALLSLARPVLPSAPISVEETGSDVILAVDESYSMKASDVEPTRLDAAKTMIRHLVRSNRSERFGVLAHTTSSIVLSPLTKDTELLLHLFDSVNETQIMTKGTQVIGALELARKMSHAPHPLVVLFTDGGDEPTYAKEADYAASNGLKVCVVMLGTAKGSTLPAADGALKDENGHIVVSSRNDAIVEIAERTGGKMINGPDVQALREWIESEGKNDFAAQTTVRNYRELYYIPLLLSLAAFIAAFTTIGERVSRKLMPLVLLFGIGAEAGMLDYPYMQAGRYDYLNGNFIRSAEWYAHVDSDIARYNGACALYKAGKYADALTQYRLVRSDRAGFKSMVFYNIGNCHVRLKEFEQARNAFLKSLSLQYTKYADQNLRYIEEAEEQHKLNVRKEKQDKFSADESAPVGSQKKGKEGGGSNMQSDIASSGAGDAQKKTEGDPRFSTSQGKAPLSSKQYELINQRSVHETKPW